MNLFSPNRILATRMGRIKTARGSALFLGYAGWRGDRVAIEPAGGVSPLRGGAEAQLFVELSTGRDH
jgi:hypothetical protein